MVDEITPRVRRRKWYRDEDLRQTFWLGVFRALGSVDDRDRVPFLIARGEGEIRNYLKANYSRTIIKHCVECGLQVGFRSYRCGCGCEEFHYSNRFQLLVDSPMPWEPDLDSIIVEQFVGTLSGIRAYVARRWLIERADLHSVNHCREIGQELGISAQAVSKHKKRIRATFKEWY